MIWEVVFGLLAYVIGSIPNSIWLGKRFYKVDVREHGSGNAGATNVFRVLGKGPGTMVFMLDVLKGFSAVKLVWVMQHFDLLRKEIGNLATEKLHEKHDPVYFEYIAILGLAFGLLAIIGHLLPVFANFKGGKGVATTFGILIAINPMVSMAALCVFILANIITGYVSVGSMAASVSLPYLFIYVFEQREWSIQCFSILVAILTVLTHRKNIIRLLAGEEIKSRLWVKSQK